MSTFRKIVNKEKINHLFRRSFRFLENTPAWYILEDQMTIIFKKSIFFKVLPENDFRFIKTLL